MNAGAPARMLGFDECGTLPLPQFLDCVIDEDRETLREELMVCDLRDKAVNQVFRVRLPDGRARWQLNRDDPAPPETVPSWHGFFMPAFLCPQPVCYIAPIQIDEHYHDAHRRQTRQIARRYQCFIGFVFP